MECFILECCHPFSLSRSGGGFSKDASRMRGHADSEWMTENQNDAYPMVHLGSIVVVIVHDLS